MKKHSNLIKYDWIDFGVDIHTITSNKSLRYSDIYGCGENGRLVAFIVSISTGKFLVATPSEINKKTLIITFDSQEPELIKLLDKEYYRVLTIWHVKSYRPFCDISLRNRKYEEKIIYPWKPSKER